MERSIDLDEADEEAAAVAAVEPARRGFLPIVTNWFDRIFVGIYLFVALELLWMRFLEQSIPAGGLPCPGGRAGRADRLEGLGPRLEAT